LTKFLRKIFKNLLDAIAGKLILLGIKPNMITLFGLVGVFIASLLIAKGKLLSGGLLILFMASMDALDGAVARLSGDVSDFGAFLDSVSDRYAEFAIFFGMLVYALNKQEHLTIILAFLAATGSVLVSYTRARAEALGVDVKLGMLTRVERFLVIIPSLIFNQVVIGLLLISILGHVTAVQRIIYTRKILET